MVKKHKGNQLCGPKGARIQERLTSWQLLSRALSMRPAIILPWVVPQDLITSVGPTSWRSCPLHVTTLGSSVQHMNPLGDTNQWSLLPLGVPVASLKNGDHNLFPDWRIEHYHICKLPGVVSMLPKHTSLSRRLRDKEGTTLCLV